MGYKSLTHKDDTVSKPLAAGPVLTLAGPVAIHEDDAQNHQEKTQPGSVLGPKDGEKEMLSRGHFLHNTASSTD
jgi:hypothetical protein